MNDGRERSILPLGDLLEFRQFAVGHERDHPLGAGFFRPRTGSSSLCTHLSPKPGSPDGPHYLREELTGNYR